MGADPRRARKGDVARGEEGVNAASGDGRVDEEKSDIDKNVH